MLELEVSTERGSVWENVVGYITKAVIPMLQRLLQAYYVSPAPSVSLSTALVLSRAFSSIVSHLAIRARRWIRSSAYKLIASRDRFRVALTRGLLLHVDSCALLPEL